MKHRLLSILLALALLFSVCIPAFAYSDTDISFPVTGGNLYFDTATGTITDCDSTVTVAVVPNTINNVPVTKIGTGAFQGCAALTSITLPSSIISIGLHAFDGTGLYNMEANWKNGVLFIGKCLIASNDKLTGSYSVPAGTRLIADGAFCRREALNAVTIADSVTILGSYAFYGCSMQNVVIPASVTSIGDGTFSACKMLKGITVEEANTAYSAQDGVLFNESKSQLLCYPAGKTATSYVYPSSVTSIGVSAFEGCSALTDAAVPNSVTSIAYGTFRSCTGLQSVSLPQSVKSIGTSAFRGCTSLKGVNLPEGISEIHDYTFSACNALTNMELPDSLKSIGKQAFEDCTSLTAISIPGYVDTIDAQAFEGCSSLKSVELMSGLKVIDDFAFSQCTALPDVKIPEGVTKLGSNAFSFCTALKTATIPASLGAIGLDAFADCTALTGAYFRGDVPSGTENAFLKRDSETGNSEPIPGLTLYYIDGKSGWTTPTWNGYATGTWTDICNHIWASSTITQPATCTQSGILTYTCSICGQTKTEIIPALAHTYVNGICVICGLKEETTPLTFTDALPGNWFYDAVSYAVSHKLMDGVGNNKFNPNSTMTRAMLVTVLWRQEGEPAGATNTFPDVPAGQWYSKAISWAAKNDIVNGMSSTSFAPNGNVTREQMAAILFRYCNKKGYNTDTRGDLSAFPDGSSVSKWAEAAMQWAVGMKFISGAEGKLLPSGNATRAQVATILMRFLEALEAG